MTSNRDHFERFQPHTLLKHAILDSYIVAWAHKLLLRKNAGNELAIVDAFAGAGQDEAGNPGSPLIAVKRSLEAIENVRLRRGMAPRITIYAIELHAGRHAALHRALKAHTVGAGILSHALRGELRDHIDRIVGDVGNAPSFYFLDPCGLKGLHASTFERVLAGPHNEVFVLFNDIGAIRMHSLATTERVDELEAAQVAVPQPSLFKELDAAAAASAVARAELKNHALDLSQPATSDHLTAALGSDRWKAVIPSLPHAERAAAFIGLFRKALLDAGAQFVLTVPMRDNEGRPKYTLVHASKSVAGFITMKECVSSSLAKGLLSHPARQQMKEDLRVEVAGVVRGLRSRLADRRVTWDNVRFAALSETALFPFQCAELKDALRGAGVLRIVGRSAVCEF